MITASHLTKIYTQPDGEKFAALNDVSFHIGRSEVVSIIGPSGAGKSTLLRTLNLLEPPTSGQILVDGQDTQAPDYPLHLLRKRMGMVFSQFNLFPRLSVLENVALAPCKVLGMPKQQAEELAMEMSDVPDGFWPVVVETGISDNYNVEILSGVEEGVTVYAGVMQNSGGMGMGMFF